MAHTSSWRAWAHLTQQCTAPALQQQSGSKRSRSPTQQATWVQYPPWQTALVALRQSTTFLVAAPVAATARLTAQHCPLLPHPPPPVPLLLEQHRTGGRGFPPSPTTAAAPSALSAAAGPAALASSSQQHSGTSSACSTATARKHPQESQEQQAHPKRRRAQACLLQAP